jgi:membrane protein
MIARRTLTTSAAVVLLSGPAWTCFAQTRRARLGAPAFLYKICEALRRFRRPNAPPLWPMGAAVRSAPEMSTSTAIRFRYRRRLPLIDIHNRPFRLCPSQPTPDPCQRMFTLARLTIRRARQERLPQVAGSLTFTTLLSIVPLLAVSFALFARFPMFSRFETALEEHLLKSVLPAEIARTVLRYLHQFAANAGALTWVGSLFLLLTAIALLLTVENVLNQIWGVKRSRPFLKRVGLYLLILAVGPPALGVSLWATSYVLGTSMGLIGTLPPPAGFVLTLGPVALSWAGLTCLFCSVPNTKVRRRDAIAGGLIASVVLELGKRGFATYLLKIPTYKVVYGAFAVFPVLLLWVYFSWLVTLAAALVAANLARAGTPRHRARAVRPLQR